MNALADVLEDFYQEVSIYKAIIITKNDDETWQLFHELQNRNHSVTFIDNYTVDDERASALVMDRLNGFKGSARILVVAYQWWYQFHDKIEEYVLPEINLIAFGTLEEDVIRYVLNRVYDSSSRGFLHDQSDIHILRLAEENYLTAESSVESEENVDA